MTNNTQAGAKLVRICLSAYTRVEYSEVISVPIDISSDELQQLANKLYEKVDGGEYVSDPEYWERGDHATSEADEGDEPGLNASRDVAGQMVIEAAPKAQEERPPSNLEV